MGSDRHDHDVKAQKYNLPTEEKGESLLSICKFKTAQDDKARRMQYDF